MRVLKRALAIVYLAAAIVALGAQVQDAAADVALMEQFLGSSTGGIAR